MANILDNAKELARLQHEVKMQAFKAFERFRTFDRLDTRAGYLRFQTIMSCSTSIEFRVHNIQDDALGFRYDFTIDELIIDECGILVSFKAFKHILEDIETFVRKVLATVE